MAARQARGLSRERLGALAGVSPRTIYNIEVEGVRARRATCHVLAEALGWSVKELFPTNEQDSPRRGSLVEAAADAGDGTRKAA
jgi:DNA-binding XRE family transcriptional regulator